MGWMTQQVEDPKEAVSDRQFVPFQVFRRGLENGIDVLLPFRPNPQLRVAGLENLQTQDVPGLKTTFAIPFAEATESVVEGIEYEVLLLGKWKLDSQSPGIAKYASHIWWQEEGTIADLLGRQDLG